MQIAPDARSVPGIAKAASSIRQVSARNCTARVQDSTKSVPARVARLLALCPRPVPDTAEPCASLVPCSA
eukprot:1540250-Rhodomonas_salina.2